MDSSDNWCGVLAVSVGAFKGKRFHWYQLTKIPVLLSVEQDGCESNPCQNGGVCRGYRRRHLCVCKDGYVGDRCQTCMLNITFKYYGHTAEAFWTCKVTEHCETNLFPPSSGKPVCITAVWEPRLLSQWQERQLQLRLQGGTHRPWLWERYSVCD